MNDLTPYVKEPFKINWRILDIFLTKAIGPPIVIYFVSKITFLQQ